MITILIITLLVLFFLTGILFIPLRLVINTKSNQYYMNLPGYFRIDVLLGLTKQPRIKIRLFFVTFIIEPFKNSRKKIRDKKSVSTHSKSTKSTGSQMTFLSNCAKQIKIRKLEAEIDTGDYPLNAQLIPVAQAVRNENVNISINFNNKNDFEIITSVQIYRFIKPGIKYLMSNS